MIERCLRRSGSKGRVPLWIAAAILGLAGTAHASENGGLVLWPDWPRVIVAPDGTIESVHVGLLVALIVFFFLLVAPVNQFVFKPILKVLDEREERIAGTRARAAQLERQADEVLGRYESSVQAVREEAERERRSLLEAARGDAVGATGEARGEAESEIEQARSEIASALDAARVTLRSQSEELARQAASSVLGRAL